MKSYTRKEVSVILNIGKETLRYYEKINLISPQRNGNGYRIYSEEDFLRIKFIIQMKKYGFSLQEITDIIDMISGEKHIDREKLVQCIDYKIEDINRKIEELTILIKVLDSVKINKNLGECDFFKSLAVHS